MRFSTCTCSDRDSWPTPDVLAASPSSRCPGLILGDSNNDDSVLIPGLVPGDHHCTISPTVQPTAQEYSNVECKELTELQVVLVALVLLH
jgi:hypothetical protein